MRVSVWSALLLLGTQLGALGSSSVMAAQANDFIQVFEALSGKHPGERKGHAKGICTIGSFQPSAGEPWLKELPLFATEQALPAQVRFSMAGGDPFVADTSRSPRGIGVRIELPDGQVHQLAGLTTPVFPGKDPDSFLGLLRASLAQREGETGAVARYLQQHPDAPARGSGSSNTIRRRPIHRSTTLAFTALSLVMKTSKSALVVGSFGLWTESSL